MLASVFEVLALCWCRRLSRPGKGVHDWFEPLAVMEQKLRLLWD